MSAQESLQPGKPVGFNGSTLVYLWVGALVLIPENLVLKPLGGAGSPAQIIGLFAGAWWLGAQLGRTGPRAPSRRSYTLLSVLVFSGLILVSYIVAVSRPISELEISAADRGLLQFASWLGVFLLVATEMDGRAPLDRALRLLVGVVGIAALLGVTQFMTGTSFVDSISIPGLSPNQTLTSVYDRNGFARSAGTSIHPIEFGVLLTMTLPFALHYAVTDIRRSPLLRWAPLIAIAIAIPVAVSRSALIGVVVVLAIILPGWPAHRRRLTYAAVVAIVGVVYVAVPGLLGTLAGLFTGVGTDDSSLSRTDSYDLAFSFIERAPLLGRGFFTFLPEYRILDNQYLGLVIEMGIVGLASFLGIFLSGAIEASRLAAGAPDETSRSLARALTASVVAGACSYATFDALSFNQVACVTFFVLGGIAMLTRNQGPNGDFDLGPVQRPARQVREFDGTVGPGLDTRVWPGVGHSIAPKRIPAGEPSGSPYPRGRSNRSRRPSE